MGWGGDFLLNGPAARGGLLKLKPPLTYYQTVISMGSIVAALPSPVTVSVAPIFRAGTPAAAAATDVP